MPNEHMSTLSFSPPRRLSREGAIINLQMGKTVLIALSLFTAHCWTCNTVVDL